MLTRDLACDDRGMDEQEQIEPDTKDWTVVITEGCAECGFDPDLDVTTTGERLRQSIVRWHAVLARPDATERPQPITWSPLEYAAHVRDVCDIFRKRLHLMLTDDDARFANWDPDTAAQEGRYGELDPDTVAQEYAVAALALAADFDQVHGEQWERRGLRSNGSEFTVSTFAIYFLHDIEHHLHDVAA